MAALAELNCNAAPASAPTVMPLMTVANFVMTIAVAQRDAYRNGYESTSSAAFRNSFHLSSVHDWLGITPNRKENRCMASNR